MADRFPDQSFDDQAALLNHINRDKPEKNLDADLLKTSVSTYINDNDTPVPVETVVNFVANHPGFIQVARSSIAAHYSSILAQADPVLEEMGLIREGMAYWSKKD